MTHPRRYALVGPSVCMQAARVADATKHEEEKEKVQEAADQKAKDAAGIAEEKEKALQHLVDATSAELQFVEAARVQLQGRHDAQAKQLADLREAQLKVGVWVRRGGGGLLLLLWWWWWWWWWLWAFEGKGLVVGGVEGVVSVRVVDVAVRFRKAWR